MKTDRRTQDRRVSPAVGAFAIGECARLRALNGELAQALQALYHQWDYVGAPADHPDMVAARAVLAEVYPRFYDCGICGHYHASEWNGDCRENGARFTMEQLDARYGPAGWVEVEMPT